MAPGRELEKDSLSQKKEKELFYRVSTSSGGKYIVSGTQLGFAKMNGPSWFGLYSVGGRKEGERDEQVLSLPLGMSDISLHVELVPEIEPVGRATAEKPSKRPYNSMDDWGHELIG